MFRYRMNRLQLTPLSSRPGIRPYSTARHAWTLADRRLSPQGSRTILQGWEWAMDRDMGIMAADNTAFTHNLQG